jgi:hypothetical protein
MEIAIEVKNEQEGELLKAGLEDPAMKAFAIVTGALSKLDNDADRERVVRATAVLFGLPQPEARRR